MGRRCGGRIAVEPVLVKKRVAAVIALCCVFSGGLKGSSQSVGSATAPDHASGFAVATIKPTDPHASGMRIEFRPNGFTARGITLREVIQEAYATYEENRLEGGPAWLKVNKFDIEAKIDTERTPGFLDLNIYQRRAMLRKLLADRFKLTLHRESRQIPTYALVIGKNGPKLHETDAAEAPQTGIKGVDMLITRSGSGELEGRNFTMPGLAQDLAGDTGRVVIDRTGLKGRYDISLHWTPDNLPTNMAGGSSTDPIGTATGDPVWPSLFTALQEQLGLRLDAVRSPVEVLVTDHVEMPSPN